MKLAASARRAGVGRETPTFGVLEHIVPQSFFEAAANNEVLQIVFFSILFAVALSQVRAGPRRRCWGSARAWRRRCSSSPR